MRLYKEEDNLFLVNKNSPCPIKIGVVYYTQDWSDSGEHEIPPGTEVEVVDIEPDTNEVLVKANDIDVDLIYDDLCEWWECDYGCDDCDDCDCIWEEAQYRADNMYYERYWFKYEQLKPVEYPTYKEKTPFLVTPNEEETLFDTAMEATKDIVTIKARAKGQILKFHNLSKLLNKKTSGLMAKFTGFCTNSWNKIPDIETVAHNMGLINGIETEVVSSNRRRRGKAQPEKVECAAGAGLIAQMDAANEMTYSVCNGLSTIRQSYSLGSTTSNVLTINCDRKMDYTVCMSEDVCSDEEIYDPKEECPVEDCCDKPCDAEPMPIEVPW